MCIFPYKIICHQSLNFFKVCFFKVLFIFLQTINSKYGYGQLKEVAALAFEEMCAAAKKDNIILSITEE